MPWTGGRSISDRIRPAGGKKEEIYIFLRGAGKMYVDGDVSPVGEGSIVRIAPGGERCWRNTGQEPLVSIVVQVREGSLRQHTFDDGIRSERLVAWG